MSVALSDWLLSLRHMYLSFLHVFSWLDSSFLFLKNFFSRLFIFERERETETETEYEWGRE